MNERKQTKKSNFKKSQRTGTGSKGAYKSASKNKAMEEFNTHSNTSDQAKERLGFNDPQWYMNNPTMANYASRVKVGHPLGATSLLTNSNTNVLPNLGSATHVLPGIMQIKLLSGPGISDAVISPSTRVMDEIITNMRFKKRGLNNYAPQDLYMYMLALGEIQMMFKLAKRAVGLVRGRVNSSVNYYEYRAIIEASGWDYDNLIKNLAYLLHKMDEYTIYCSKWFVPDDFDYYKRISMLYDTYYYDANSVTAQSYIFVPYGYRVFNATKYETGSALTFTRIEDKLTVEKWVGIMEEMFLSLRNEDLITMNGDIAYVYKSNALISPVPSDYSIPHGVYDILMLQQIRNCTLLGRVKDDTCDITQNPSIGADYIEYCPVFKPLLDVQAGPIFLNRIYSSDGTIEQASMPGVLFEATRLMNIPVPRPGSTNEYYLINSGTEVALSGKIFVFRDPNTMEHYVTAFENPVSFDDREEAIMSIDMYNMLAKASHVTKFFNHPSHNITLINNAGAVDHYYNVDEINTYGIIDVDMLNDLHRVALQSLWMPRVDLLK